jgi:uncharacterized delta-60 repeat protein
MWFRSTRQMRYSHSSSCVNYRPCLDALEDRILPSAPGTLDTGFGSGGIVTTSFGTRSNDYGFGVAVQADGKVVAAAGSLNGPKRYLDVIRYNPNGSLDSSFGSGGEVQTPFSNSTTSGGLVLQPDGKILVGTTVNNAFELVRYNTNGSLDKTFGGTGIVSTAFPSNGAQLWGLSLESVSGVSKIVAAGYNSFNDGHFGFALARYDLNGALDTSFGSGGKVVTDLGYDIGGHGLAIQGDGQIIVAGTNNPAFVWIVARYGTNGSLDPAFGSGGVATGSFKGSTSSVIVQPDAKIVVGGFGDQSSGRLAALERLNSDGSLDTNFGTSGAQVGPFAGTVWALAIQANGKLVADGAGGAGFGLARFNPEGDVDTTFGTGGQVTTVINGGGSSGGMSLQADGKIIAVGFAPSAKNGIPTIALARYWGDPVPVINSFTASPNAVTSGSIVTLTASNITDANPSSTITQVAIYVASNTGNGQLNSNDTLLGYATQTGPGVWTFNFTVNLTPGSYTVFAQAEDSLGIFSYPDALTLIVH